MEPMDATQARDHIEMVERILVESQQRLCAGGEFFVVWGLYSAAATIVWQLINNRVAGYSLLWLTGACLLGAVVFSRIRGRQFRLGAARRSLVQREFFNVTWLAVGLAFVANVAAFNVFSGWAQAAIWTFAETLVLFYIGMHGNRRALLGGIVMIASLVAANFVGDATAGYVLGAGMLLGYAGFGVAELLSRE